MWQRYLRRPAWLQVLTVFLVVAGVILAATKDYLPGGALIVVALVVTQLGPKVIEWVEGLRTQHQEEASLLRIRGPIGEVDPFKEGLVFQSALAERDYPDRMPAYIPRGDRGDIDARLDKSLRADRYVLVTGASKSGKTRTAFEAARRLQPEPTLLVPAEPRALPKLLRLDDLPVDRSQPSVLWLDELDRYLQDPGLSRVLFDDLRKQESRVVILATITLTAYDRLRTGADEIGRSAREILSLFEAAEITLPSELSSSEHEEAQRLYPSQHFTAGIGEHFAAARELIERFKTAIEAHRHGFAVVVSVLYWRLAGMRRPVAEAELRELYTLCLERFYPLLKANDKDYQDGAAWAREPLESRAALLVPTTGGGVEGFKIFDYVRDWSEGRGGDVDQRLRTVPEPIWRYVVDRAVPREAGAVGAEAYTRGKLDAAKDAWTKVVASGDPEGAPLAALSLGELFSEQGDNAQAERAYQKAIDSEHSEWAAPTAAFLLGGRLVNRGENARAEQAFQKTVDFGHSEFAPAAAWRLGTLFEERGENARAEQAYQKAIDSGNPEWAPAAATTLGLLLEKRGENARAEQAYQKAIDSGNPEWAPTAAFLLGKFLVNRGENARAEQAYQKAIDSGNPEVAPGAAINLGALLEERGENARAEQAYQKAIDSGHSKFARQGTLGLQRLHSSSSQ